MASSGFPGAVFGCFGGVAASRSSPGASWGTSGGVFERLGGVRVGTVPPDGERGGSDTARPVTLFLASQGSDLDPRLERNPRSRVSFGGEPLYYRSFLLGKEGPRHAKRALRRTVVDFSLLPGNA